MCCGFALLRGGSGRAAARAARAAAAVAASAPHDQPPWLSADGGGAAGYDLDVEAGGTTEAEEAEGQQDDDAFAWAMADTTADEADPEG